MEERSPEIHLAELARQLHCCSRQIRALLNEQVKSFELNDTEFLLLWICSQAGSEPPVQGQVVAAIGLSPAQLSGIVDRLHKRGLLRVERCDRDRRRQLLRVTDIGNEALQAALNAVQPAANSVVQRMSEAERRQLLELSQQLLAACQETNQEASANVKVINSSQGAAA